MNSLILQEPGKFHYKQTESPNAIGPDEALLKVHRIGICGTDLHAYAGVQPYFSYPRILGHELGVEVVDIGDEVESVNIGDKCSIEPYRFTNSEDPAVQKGKPNCAEHLSVLGVHEDGGMREYFTFPAKFLHTSSKLSYEQLALIEPLSIGCHAVNRASITGEDEVMVIGAGPIGLGTIQFAKAAGAQVAVMEIDKRRLEFCRNMVDISGYIKPGDGSTEEQIRSVFGGKLPSVVLDATGSHASMEKAFDYVAHGGRLVFVGLFQGDVTFSDPDFHKKELTLMASRNALSAEFDQIIHAIEENEIDTSSWITHRTNFGSLADTFEQWLNADELVIKAMAEFESKI